MKTAAPSPADIGSAKTEARKLAAFAKERGHACAFEVIARNHGRGPLVVQPFGLSALFKSHRVLHVEPIPS